jgi:hypothetical protein
MSMNNFSRGLRALISLITAVGFSVTAIDPGSVWRCRDGTPCATQCLMHGAQQVAVTSAPLQPGSACAACPRQASLLSEGPRLRPAGPLSHCVLTVSSRPDLLAQAKNAVPYGRSGSHRAGPG